MSLEAYKVHMRDGRVFHWIGEGIFDAAHKAGYGSGIFDQIKYAEIIGRVDQPSATTATANAGGVGDTPRLALARKSDLA